MDETLEKIDPELAEQLFEDEMRADTEVEFVEEKSFDDSPINLRVIE